MSNFAENLKSYRAKKGFSQEGLAKAIGVHATHLSRYERGLSMPSIEVVQKISDILQVSIDQLVHGSSQYQIDHAFKDRELLELFKRVQMFNDKQKEIVKDLIDAYVLKTDLQNKLAS